MAKKGCHCPRGAKRIKGGRCMKAGKFVAKVGCKKR